MSINVLRYNVFQPIHTTKKSVFRSSESFSDTVRFGHLVSQKNKEKNSTLKNIVGLGLGAIVGNFIACGLIQGIAPKIQEYQNFHKPIPAQIKVEGKNEISPQLPTFSNAEPHQNDSSLQQLIEHAPLERNLNIIQELVDIGLGVLFIKGMDALGKRKREESSQETVRQS